jgi:hypothetical protein
VRAQGFMHCQTHCQPETLASKGQYRAPRCEMQARSAAVRNRQSLVNCLHLHRNSNPHSLWRLKPNTAIRHTACRRRPSLLDNSALLRLCAARFLPQKPLILQCANHSSTFSAWRELTQRSIRDLTIFSLMIHLPPLRRHRLSSRHSLGSGCHKLSLLNCSAQILKCSAYSTVTITTLLGDESSLKVGRQFGGESEGDVAIASNSRNGVILQKETCCAALRKGHIARC